MSRKKKKLIPTRYCNKCGKEFEIDKLIAIHCNGSRYMYFCGECNLTKPLITNNWRSSPRL